MNYRNKYPKSKYPFSDELCAFMDQNSEFYESLKLSNEKRFKFLEPIVTSHLPESEGEKSYDEIIGMFYLDRQKRSFKQDYLVNAGCQNKEYISYTRGKNSARDKNVRSIHEFYLAYGKSGKCYHKSGALIYEHRYATVDDLPDISTLKENARNSLNNV